MRGKGGLAVEKRERRNEMRERRDLSRLNVREDGIIRRDAAQKLKSLGCGRGSVSTVLMHRLFKLPALRNITWHRSCVSARLFLFYISPYISFKSFVCI